MVLNSILSNLISNSIKYSDNKKTEKFIKITFLSEKGKAVLKVEDNGIGIRKKEFSKVFERKFQVDEKSSEGGGIGLYMVQKSVLLLGGTINFKSNFGIGTEFIVELPIE